MKNDFTVEKNNLVCLNIFEVGINKNIIPKKERFEMASEKVITITKDNFNDEVLDSDIPVLVDFWASWCGPCRMVAPVMDELAEEFDGKVKIGKINVDEQRELAEKYRVMSIPTIFLFKNGEVVDKTVGAKPKDEFAAMLNENM